MTETPTYPMPRGRCPFDPPPALARIQENQAVTRVRIWDGSTPWVVSGYDNARAVLADPRVSADSLLPGYPSPSAGVAAGRQKSRSFINMDDPEHAAQRRMLTPSFMVKKMEALRPRIQEIVDGLIDDMLAGPKPADLVQAFALPVPSLVICELLGVSYEDHDYFQDVSRKLISRDTTAEELAPLMDDFLAFLGKHVDSKADNPGDDLISSLVVDQMSSGALTRDEIVHMARLLLVAGHETTANMIALGTLALLEHPDQLAALRDTDDPKLVAGAVEELLRYLTITHSGRRRVALEDIEVGGRTIRAGEGIIVASDIANRDATASPEPDSLDITRKARHHLAFGYGVHQCLGQPLARVELQVVYSTLYRRIPTLALAEPLDQVKFKHDMLVYGVHELAVTW